MLLVPFCDDENFEEVWMRCFDGDQDNEPAVNDVMK